MKNLRWTLVALLLAAAPQIANAQVPSGAPMGAPSTTTTTTTTSQSAPDSGTISTSSTDSTVTTTSTTGISPDASVTPMDDTMSETTMSETTMTDGTLPNTGGEPIIMSLVGLAIAGAAFGVRRKVTA